MMIDVAADNHFPSSAETPRKARYGIDNSRRTESFLEETEHSQTREKENLLQHAGRNARVACRISEHREQRFLATQIPQRLLDTVCSAGEAREVHSNGAGTGGSGMKHKNTSKREASSAQCQVRVLELLTWKLSSHKECFQPEQSLHLKNSSASVTSRRAASETLE